MKLTNNEIYTYAQQLSMAFQDGAQRLPFKLNFFIQKNKNNLINLAQDIEKSRLEIAKTYGELDQDSGQFNIASDKTKDVQKELEDLFNLEQEVYIYMIKADSLSDDFLITIAQMEAIMFMIEEV